MGLALTHEEHWGRALHALDTLHRDDVQTGPKWLREEIRRDCIKYAPYFPVVEALHQTVPWPRRYWPTMR